MSTRNALESLLALPYNPTRDFEPIFTAFKRYCADPAFRKDPTRHIVSRRVHALYDVLLVAPVRKAELDKIKSFSYPFDSLPASYFEWVQKNAI